MRIEVCDFISSHGLVLAGTQSGDHLNLVSGHAYSLTGFGGDVNHGKCIRIRNPWGQLDVIGSEPNMLNHDADGEFVLKWDTFCKHFFCLTVKASVSDVPRYALSPTPPSMGSSLPSSRQRSRSSSISTFLTYLHLSRNNIDRLTKSRSKSTYKIN